MRIILVQDSYKKEEVIGALFPIIRRHANKLFSTNQVIFIKFTKLNKLTKGAIIIFYVSGEKVLIGESIVKKIDKMNPEKAWIEYWEKMFLDKKDYDQYIKMSPIENKARKMKELTVFSLSKLKKYEHPYPSVYPVTASGRYVTNKMMSKIKSMN